MLLIVFDDISRQQAFATPCYLILFPKEGAVCVTPIPHGL